MLKSTDIQGRLNLLRYGLIVVTILSFLIALLVPFVFASAWAAEVNLLVDANNQANPEGGLDRLEVGIGDFLITAIIVAVVVAVVSVIIYLVYAQILKRTVAPEGGSSAASP